MSIAFSRRTPGPGLVALVVVLLAAGCSSGSADDQEPPLGEVSTILAATDLHLPAQDYLMTADQALTLARANLVLIQRCMSRFGFSYDVGPVTESPYGPASITERRYGITDLALAQQYGYGLGPRDPALAPARVDPGLNADGQTALTGSGPSQLGDLPVPDGGCLGEADTILNESVPPGVNIRIANDLQMASFEQARADSRVRAVDSQWSQCMATAGFHYTDPLAAAGDPSFSDGVTPQQIAVALADIDCKGTTNLVGVWFAVDSAYENRTIDENRKDFDAAKAAIAQRDTAAQAILG